jgi:hypothetical protein
MPTFVPRIQRGLTNPLQTAYTGWLPGAKWIQENPSTVKPPAPNVADHVLEAPLLRADTLLPGLT